MNCFEYEINQKILVLNYKNRLFSVGSSAEDTDSLVEWARPEHSRRDRQAHSGVAGDTEWVQEGSGHSGGQTQGPGGAEAHEPGGGSPAEEGGRLAQEAGQKLEY